MQRSAIPIHDAGRQHARHGQVRYENAATASDHSDNCRREQRPARPGVVLFFFFSSRRRHTRSLRDWIQTCALPISEIIVKSLQRFDQQVIHWKPNWTAPIGIASKQTGARFGRLVLYAMLVPANPEDVGIGRSEERRVGKECSCGWWTEHGREKEMIE